jgi:hypothetical protein
LALKEACDRYDYNLHDLRITLPEDDPSIFELFVEWMYDGTYTLDLSSPLTKNSEVSRDVQAWVLGDRLQSTGFKNYSMDRLYAQFATTFAQTPITTADVHYTFTQSSLNSKLRMFLRHFLSIHLLNPTRAKGTSAEWDDVLQEHAKLRRFLLSRLRAGMSGFNSIRS